MTRKGVRTLVRVILWGILCVYFVSYLAAKIHFIGWYGRIGLVTYLREHVWFWIGMFGLGFLIWIIERILGDAHGSEKS